MNQIVVSGYEHPDYAASLSEIGGPQLLPESGGWILRRPVPGFDYCDAMACYPIFVCRNWQLLKADLQSIGDDLVCLSAVTDPFGEYDLAYLQECFADVVRPFKQHFVIDLSRPVDTFIQAHHRRNARRALRRVQVAKCDNPADVLDDWNALYRVLIERHNIAGIAAFSRAAFARQLSVPGMVVIRAVQDGETVGMLLWYEQDNRAYYHLGAYSRLGYELGASFALFDYSIRYFAQQDFDWLNLGAGAGLGSSESGLDRFKQGWSTGTRTAYFCGRVFNPRRYQEVIRARNVPTTDYFPAYRRGEFN